MNHLNKDSFKNQRKVQASERKVENTENEMLDLEAKDHQKIFWIQQRLDVSRGEALRIFKNSLL